MYSKLHRRDFRLASLLLLIATVMLGSTWYGARQVEAYIIEKQAEYEVFKWARFAEVHLAGINQILMYGRASDADESLIATMAEANNVLRYRFFNRAGFIVLSSIPGEVGSRDVNRNISDVVLQGGTYIKLQEEGRFSDLQPDLHGGAVLPSGAGSLSDFDLRPGSVLAEAYSAVMDEGRFSGAIEVHVNVTQTAEIVRDVMGLARQVMLGFVALMLATTAFVIFRNIRDRNRELDEVRTAQNAAVRARNEIGRPNAAAKHQTAERSEPSGAAQHYPSGFGGTAA